MADKNTHNDTNVAAVLLDDISEETKQEILSLAKKLSVPAGTLLFKQDEPGESFYLINSGKVRVYRTDENGTQMELSVMGPGESFGEMALMTGEPRSANVETLTETELTVLGKEQFQMVLKDNPNLSIQFVKQLSTWIRKDEKKLAQEARQRAPSVSLADFGLVLMICLLCGLIFNHANPNSLALLPQGFPKKAAFMVEPETVTGKFRGNVLVIDARPAVFYNEKHIKGAVNLPYALFDIMYMMLTPQIDEADHIVIYGNTISRRYDEDVTRKLELYGYKNINILSGGVNAWEKKGYPTEP